MKTTHKDFQRFKAEFILWQKRLGLMDWRVCFEHGNAHDCYAEIFANAEGRISTVVFADKCEGDALLGYDPKATGRHEALELLLSKLKDIARARDFLEADLDETVHAVIRRLENLFSEWEAKK